MKKKVGILLFLIAVIVVMAISGRYNRIIDLIRQDTEDGGSKIISEVVVSSVSTAQNEQNKVNPEDIQEFSYTEGYAYNLLKEEEKKLYVEILNILNSLEKEVVVSSSDVEQVVKIHEYVCADNPELFWVEGYQILPYEMAGKTVKVKYSGIYTMSLGEKTNYQKALETKVEPWLAEIASCPDDYSKVKKAYELIILNTDYEPDAKENQNILSVFLNGKSVCQGYAEAFQFLCKHSGIQNITVTGDATNADGTQPHAWNLVSMDGKYYQFDITWGDPNYQVTENVVGEVNWEISYKYFGLTDFEMSLSHTADTKMELPKCTSIDNNYYVKEGYYYTELDKKQLKLQFMAAEAAGEGAVHIRCDNNLLYQEMVSYLIEDSKVFYIIQNYTEIKYSLDEDMRCISIFWETKE